MREEESQIQSQQCQKTVKLKHLSVVPAHIPPTQYFLLSCWDDSNTRNYAVVPTTTSICAMGKSTKSGNYLSFECSFIPSFDANLVCTRLSIYALVHGQVALKMVDCHVIEVPYTLSFLIIFYSSTAHYIKDIVILHNEFL